MDWGVDMSPVAVPKGLLAEILKDGTCPLHIRMELQRILRPPEDPPALSPTESGADCPTEPQASDSSRLEGLGALPGHCLSQVASLLPLAELLAVRTCSARGLAWATQRAARDAGGEAERVRDRVRARLWIERAAALTKDTADETVFETQIRSFADDELRRRMEAEMTGAKTNMERQIHAFQLDVDRRMEEQAQRVHAIIEERVHEQVELILAAEMEKVRVMAEERVQERVRMVLQNEILATVREMQARLTTLAEENDHLRSAFTEHLDHSDLCYRSLVWALSPNATGIFARTLRLVWHCRRRLTRLAAAVLGVPPDQRKERLRVRLEALRRALDADGGLRARLTAGAASGGAAGTAAGPAAAPLAGEPAGGEPAVAAVAAASDPAGGEQTTTAETATTISETIAAALFMTSEVNRSAENDEGGQPCRVPVLDEALIAETNDPAANASTASPATSDTANSPARDLTGSEGGRPSSASAPEDDVNADASDLVGTSIALGTPPERDLAESMSPERADLPCGHPDCSSPRPLPGDPAADAADPAPRAEAPSEPPELGWEKHGEEDAGGEDADEEGAGEEDDMFSIASADDCGEEDGSPHLDMPPESAEDDEEDMFSVASHGEESDEGPPRLVPPSELDESDFELEACLAALDAEDHAPVRSEHAASEDGESTPPCQDEVSPGLESSSQSDAAEVEREGHAATPHESADGPLHSTELPASATEVDAVISLNEAPPLVEPSSDLDEPDFEDEVRSEPDGGDCDGALNLEDLGFEDEVLGRLHDPEEEEGTAEVVAMLAPIVRAVLQETEM